MTKPAERLSFLLAFTLGCLLAGILGMPGASSAAEPPEMVVVFDESGSMERYDPKLASKLWLMTFVRTFETPHRLVLTGFDEAAREHMAVPTDDAEGMAALEKHIDAIEAKGLATDFERPLAYLRHKTATSQPALVLLVSDGQPEIWDAKLGYLSEAVRDDPRYGALNEKLMALKDQSPAARYDRLGIAYHERNLALIEEHLPNLQPRLAGRLIIWDLSGRSYFLRRWAEALGAQYLPLRIADQESPVEQLQKAMVLLQEKTAAIIDQPLPADHAARVRDVLTSAAETREAARDLPIAEIPPEAEPEPETRPSPSAPPAPTPGMQKDEESSSNLIPLLGAVLLILVVGLVLMVRFRRRHREGPESEPQPVVLVPTAMTSDFIEDRVRATMAEAEEARDRLLSKGYERIDNDKRFAPRVKVPDGAMIVHWVNRDGQMDHGPAVDLSMHGVLFAAGDRDMTGAIVTRIQCPILDVTLEIIDGRLDDRGDGLFVALPETFAKGVDDKMRWIELLTRIDAT
ncbi:vWA domain-containing protein [Magnetospira sp. QH-2]|uniref:vWA domain-containing protein n=1 Tax=Magnetospira sp. (strain QH-2) TaxID=1288970 RepID=UPI0003E810FE|nr:vWA domain-containing protein [Magnetospira sp. QH-2]CCQ75591.1 conserved exported protein of unknown function [Magnetospira sp. QH-2]